MKVGIEGAIVGGVVGVVSAIVYTWWSKRKQKRNEGPVEGVKY
jgi:hypothetical protein